MGVPEPVSVRARINLMPRKWLLHILLVLCSIFVTLLAAELIVRITGIWVKDSYADRDYFAASAIPGVPYRLKPNAHARWAKTNIVTNSEGIREEKEYNPATEGVFRILTIGDSITFGMGVDQGHTYPKQLEALLNTGNKNELNYEVINAGISGFNAGDEACFLTYLNEKYSPNLIIWLIIPNDYDDSLGVNDNGQMTWNIPGYAATSSWLEQTWGLKTSTIDTENFLESMDEAHRCLALNRPYRHHPTLLEATTGYLAAHSYLFGFFSARLNAWIRENDSLPLPPPHVLIRKIPIRLADGSTDRLPEISSIFLSPFYKKRFQDAIQKGIRTAVDSHVRLAILGINMYMNDLPADADIGIFVQDVAEYLEMPVSRFWPRYNLGWDPHLNPAGNQLLAHAVLNFLLHKGLVTGLAESAGDDTGPARSTDPYWRMYEKALVAYTQKIEPVIDFKRFKNIHQVVGGINPACVIPIKGSARLSVVLKGVDSDVFRVSGVNGSRQQDVTVEIFTGQTTLEATVSLPPGKFNVQTVIPGLSNFDGNVMDVQLGCSTDGCRNIKLDCMGVGAGS